MTGDALTGAGRQRIVDIKVRDIVKGRAADATSTKARAFDEICALLDEYNLAEGSISAYDSLDAIETVCRKATGVERI